MGMVIRKTVDLASIFSFTLERAQVVDFLPIIGTTTLAILIRNVNYGKENFKWMVYQEPFSTSLWAAILIFALVMSFSITVIEIFDSKEIQMKRTVQVHLTSGKIKFPWK